MLFFLLVVDCKTLFVTFICFHCKSLASVLALFSCVLGFLLFLITVLNWRRDAERCEPFIGGGGEVFMIFFFLKTFSYLLEFIYFVSSLEDFWIAAKSGMVCL